MKAAVVGDFGHPPRYGDFGTPDIQPDEVAVNVRAAALSQLVRAQAAGRHYSAAAGLPSGIIAACVGKGSGAAERRVRFIQIGTVAGDPVALHGGILRSSGLELLGTGLGSVSHAALIGATGDMLKVASQAGFKVAAAAIPLSDVESAWGRDTNERIVFTMPGVRT